MKKTKIVATMGPSSLKREVWKNMMLEGLNVCRLNFSHGSFDDHAGAVDRRKSIISLLRRVQHGGELFGCRNRHEAL
mgnify:CR=1 FL=1